MKVYFKESQRLRLWWLYILIAIALLYGVVQLVSRYFVSRLAGDVPQFKAGALAVWLALGAAVLVVLFFCKLHTTVTEEEIWVQFFPFHLRPIRIPIRQIKFMEPLVYSPVQEYGGWGIRSGIKGKAYSVSGTKGVRLIYGPENSRILIGSQKARKFAEAIREAQLHAG